MRQQVIVNADDYGMDASVDDAILRLADQGVVTAASVMTLAPRWPDVAAPLRERAIDCGLHLDLTSPFAAAHGGTSLKNTILKSYVYGWDHHWLRTSIARQLDLYEAGMGTRPVFVDGHQHVHQLPGVRDALFSVLSDRYAKVGAKGIRLRDCRPKRWRGPKAAVVGALGGKGLADEAISRGYSLNSDFAGVYDFSARTILAGVWRSWLDGLQGPNPLIMCHPASETGTAGHDPIRAARLREYAFLSSGSFATFLRTQDAHPARWPAARE